MLPYHLSQLAAFCKIDPIRPKVVFVPIPQVGHNLTTALAATGQAWANLYVTTPVDWAERMVGPREGWARLVQDADLFFLEDLIARILRDDPDNAFAAQSMSSGLSRSFLRTLHALRIAGVDPDDLEQVEPSKGGLLAALYREYRSLLEAGRTYDSAALFERAIGCVGEDPREKDDTLYAVLDETPLPGLAFEFVRTLAGRALYRIGRPGYGVAPPAHSAAARFPDAPFPKAAPVYVGVGGKLLSKGLSASDGETVRLREALGSETEVRGALRDIHHRRIPLDTVEIAYTVESPYSTLLYDAAERFDLPTAFASGIPVGLTRPGQALSGFYRWIGSGFDAAEWIGLCRAGLLSFNRALEPGERLEPDRVAAILSRARIGQGRERYATAFDRLEREMGDALDMGDDDRSADRACLRLVRRVMEVLFNLAPEGPKIRIQSFTEASVQFLLRFAPIRGERDAKAQESLVDRLNEIGATVEREDTVVRLAQRLADLITQHKVEASVARPGHLYAVPIERAGYSNRRQVYVVGMDGASFPGGAGEDPILLDDERAGLSGELALHRTRPAEQVWHLVRLLGMAGGAVTLFSNRRSLSDGRETYPSALFQQAAVQLEAGAPVVVPPIPALPELALEDGEAMLSVYGASGYENAVRACFPWLVDGENAAQSRAGRALTRFDGWLVQDTPDLDPTHIVLSASRLETLAKCPYRYFLRYVLGVEPVDEPVEDPARWLSPTQFGSLLHDLFCTFMRTLHTQDEAPNEAKHTELLNTMLREQIAKHREHTPVRHEAAYRADIRRLERAAQVFLAVESRHQQGDPVGFEVSFGFGETGGLNRRAPVPIDLSERVKFRLQGRIDRIDRVGDAYEIWDYKTGSMARYDERDLLKRGTNLQWALYAYALEQILRSREHPVRVQQSGYLFVGDREHGRRIGSMLPQPDALAEMLAPLFDLAAQGCFFHAQKKDQCTYCDYNRLCAPERILPKDMGEINAAMADRPDILDALNRWMEV